MITLVQGVDRKAHPKLIDGMHKLRAEVFGERLGWEVVVKQGREIDRFDDCNPLYVIVHDEFDTVLGCLRLLPTTGPNMLADVFSDLLEGEEVRSPLIWESSRFCTSQAANLDRLDSGLNRTTGELLAALCEVGMLAGLKSIVTVFDPVVRRLGRLAGGLGEEIGTPKRFGKVTAYAGLYPTDPAMLARIREATGIEYSVLVDHLHTMKAAA